MENTCKLELEINWPLLEKKDNFNLREIKTFFKKALNLPYLKLENDKMWVGEPESITALVSVIEKNLDSINMLKNVFFMITMVLVIIS
jgi:hypothetical protein